MDIDVFTDVMQKTKTMEMTLNSGLMKKGLVHTHKLPYDHWGKYANDIYVFNIMKHTRYEPECIVQTHLLREKKAVRR